MRIALMSDVHANLAALEAVLADVNKEGYDILVNLGDVVGYGPDPEACAQMVKETSDLVLMGNHDLAAVDHRKFKQGKKDILETFAVKFEFNATARQSLEWTEQQLSEDSVNFLAGLPLTAYKATKPLKTELYHAAPHAYRRFNRHTQTNWDYAISNKCALESLLSIGTGRIAFYGHSHYPGVYHLGNLNEEFRASRAGHVIAPTESKLIVNVGSVGQPRDENPDACYCIYDTKKGTIKFRSVDYKIDRTTSGLYALQAQLENPSSEESKWPIKLASRLFSGR